MLWHFLHFSFRIHFSLSQKSASIALKSRFLSASLTHLSAVSLTLEVPYHWMSFVVADLQGDLLPPRSTVVYWSLCFSFFGASVYKLGSQLCSRLWMHDWLLVDVISPHRIASRRSGAHLTWLHWRSDGFAQVF
ncbi:uncharacterized protein [Malus domestica]|uniref:uncharacterized protein isoform X4 n=1 Tax=Malus domestica TaxID=3750 RepID=UPI0010AAF1F6|nr:uncharacterized protein LOC103445995 [Malus domestica]